jgi:aminoglycoside phosphotransferase (APT) family kinase protein
VDLGDLGRTIRILHTKSRGIPLGGLPRIDPLGDVRSWIHSSGEWLGFDDRRQLASRFEFLASWWNEFSSEDALEKTLIHGDIHRDNALKTEDGIILIDLENSGVGPPGWDLVPLAVGVRRYGDSKREFELFVDGYGEDPRKQPSFETLCEIYELTVTLWATQCAEVTPGMVEEAKIRVEGFLGRSSIPWTMC